MNHLETPAWRLAEEAVLVRNSLDSIDHGPERRKQLEGRLGLVALELLCRQAENQGEDPRTVLAFSSVDYFGLHAPAPGLELAHSNIQIEHC